MNAEACSRLASTQPTEPAPTMMTSNDPSDISWPKLP
jgi:hypothetical protein